MNVQNRLSSFPYRSIVLCAILPKTRTLVHATDPTTKTIPIHTKNITENKAHVNMNCGIIFFRYRDRFVRNIFDGPTSSKHQLPIGSTPKSNPWFSSIW